MGGVVWVTHSDLLAGRLAGSGLVGSSLVLSPSDREELSCVGQRVGRK